MTAKTKARKSVDTAEKGVDSERPIIPDGGYGWVVLVAAFMVSFIMDGCLYSQGFILDYIKINFDAPQDIVNLIPSLNTGFLFCSGPLVSALCAQFGVRSVVMIGGIVTSAMYIVSAFVPSVFYMMATIGVIGGISSGCTYIASLIIIADYFELKRGIATGITMAGSGVGAFVFGKIIQPILQLTDWKFTLILIGCVILLCTLMGAFLRSNKALEQSKKAEARAAAKQNEMKSLTHHQHDSPSTSASHHESRRNSQQATVATYMGSLTSIHDSSADKKGNKFVQLVCSVFKEMTDFKLMTQCMPFLLIALSNLFIFSGYMVPFIYVPIVDKKMNIDATWILSIIGLVNIPARIAFGFLADRKIISSINLNTLSVALATASLFVFKFLDTLYLQLIFSVTFAIGIAGLNSLTTPYLCDMVGLSRFGNATGIINLMRGVGCFIGPFLAGKITDTFDNNYLAFYYSGICFTIGLVFTLLISIRNVFGGQQTNQPADVNQSGDDSQINKKLLAANA